jgi:ABC-type nickel/cobalt efflux system permease component RcnA
MGGILMGAFHVLSGPDHLSALATLSVGSSWKALYLGLRWGIGHSIGLLLIALLFMALDGYTSFDLRKISHHLNIVVGIFMIFLGIHGIWVAVRDRYFSDEENIPSETDRLIKFGINSDDSLKDGASDPLLRESENVPSGEQGENMNTLPYCSCEICCFTHLGIYQQDCDTVSRRFSYVFNTSYYIFEKI